jgi:SlyX protein
MNIEDLQQAIIDLQTRFAFQEDLLQVLNQTVVDQAKQIEQLQLRIHQLEQALVDLQDVVHIADVPQAPPPHY